MNIELNKTHFTFVCNKCRCIDKSQLVLPDQIVYDDHQPKSTEEMLESHEMVCSECNTGTWHGIFKKEIATKEEIALASFSKFNAITPYDQPEISIIPSLEARYGYVLAPIGIGMFNQMYMYAMNEKLNGFLVTDHPLYHKWLEQGKNFNVQELLDIRIEDMGKMIREQKINGQHKPGVINESDALANQTAINQAAADKMAESLKPKPHWKETQSEQDKEKTLRKAELKREIKKVKKAINDGDSGLATVKHLADLTEECKKC